MIKKILLLASSFILTGALSGVLTADTLDQVKKRGKVRCAVSQGLPGFSVVDDKGNWTGIDVDYCRAVAAAIFGDDKKVDYKPTSAKVRFTTLTSGEVDILSRNTTWTFDRDTSLGLNFVGVNYYDGQGFMVRKSLGVKDGLELDGAAVCTNTGTTTELNATDFFRSNNLKFKLVAFEKADEVVAAYDAGRCDVYTTDRSALAAQATKLSKPKDHVVLPNTISKEPLGPAVKQGDDEWTNLTRWVLNATIVAEELGINSKNVSRMKKSKNPEIQRLLGVSGELHKNIGLDKDWAYNIIKLVGNYGESYEEHITPLGLARGVNRLWTKGGILYAPPIR
jgi:general L-amino acid transport system substrate-binding protein